MIQLFLDDFRVKELLYPFTLTRSAADIRIGILTIRQKWEFLLGQKVRVQGDGWLDGPGASEGTPPILFPANIVPTQAFLNHLAAGNQEGLDILNHPSIRILQYPWQIFQYNDWALREDFEILTHGRVSEPLPTHVQAIQPQQIFIEKGAQLAPCVINASTGPVYIGPGAEIMEGALIRGPLALCEGAVIKMGARIYGASTIGPYCVAGGEIKNSVMFSYSNKAHDGYLGDSVIGSWCNLGAGSSNSNIKNSAGEVRVWNETAQGNLPAGIKCGLLMGDFSRAAINTSFNTGTTIGVSCNIFGSGLTPKNIRSFTWGMDPGTKYEFPKALEDITNWKKLKNQALSEKEIQTLQHIFDNP